jgi:hypothetical protein
MNLITRTAFGVGVLLMVTGAAIAAEPPPVDVSRLLPGDGVTVDVMQPTFPKRLQELAVKLQAALAKDPAWTKSHVSQAKPGEPLPYDEKLGLTKAEYEEFLELTKKGGMAKVADAKVRVQRDGDRVVLHFGKRFQGMEKIEVDLKNDSASTPAGMVATRQAIKASSEQAATGPWDGVQWKSKGFEEDISRPSVSLAVGKLEATGRGILYYRVRPGNSNSAAAVQYVLFYDLPKQQ